MAAKVLSNITSLNGRPLAFQFLIVFAYPLGHTEEFVFISSSLSQCVTQCTALINYMFAYKYVSAVYIFPTNSNTVYRNVYARMNGQQGEYKLIRCNLDVILTLEDVRAHYVGG